MHCPRTALVFLACLVLPWFAVRAAGPDPAAADEQTLKTAGVGTDGPSLLEFFRKRTLNDVDGDRIAKLIRDLGDDSFKVREAASADLAAIGAAAEPLLRLATRDPDIEIVRRAEKCLKLIKSGSGAVVPLAAARLVRLRQPEGAAAVLLAYLPFADNDFVAEEVRQTLAAVALRGGKADTALVEALTDKAPLRRGAAAEALCRAGGPEAVPAVRKLLKDPDDTVRFKVALALAHARQKDAIPVLIDLLAELPQGQAWQVEDFLCRLADDQAPPVPLGSDAVARQKCRQAWAAWWDKQRDTIDLAKLDREPQLLGYNLVILLDRNLVMELGKDNRPRWKIDDLQFPLDAQLLPGDRVLIAEQGGNRVTERTTKGDVVWEYKIDSPLMAQRLPNGNTFMATRTQLLEVTRDGKEVYSHARPGNDFVMRALKLRTGEIACVTMSRRFVRLDAATGKEEQSFPVNVQTSGGRIDVLPNGRVIVPEMGANRVVEYDAEGKEVWQATVEQPIVAVRLPNGNTLVTSMTQNRAVELNREGKEVWEYKSDTRVTRAWRR